MFLFLFVEAERLAELGMRRRTSWLESTVNGRISRRLTLFLAEPGRHWQTQGQRFVSLASRLARWRATCLKVPGRASGATPGRISHHER